MDRMESEARPQILCPRQAKADPEVCHHSVAQIVPNKSGQDALTVVGELREKQEAAPELACGNRCDFSSAQFAPVHLHIARRTGFIFCRQLADME
jgi:hypothetical protein